jgi:hypothetical protein
VRQFAARADEFERRGLPLVRVSHSPVGALRDYVEGPGAVPFAVLADPGRRVYRAYGIGASWLAFLRARGALGRVREATRTGLKPRWSDALRDGIGGSPADFLIDASGLLERVHYGAHHADSLTPETALAWITGPT